jgi:hypothetical protein
MPVAVKMMLAASKKASLFPLFPLNQMHQHKKVKNYSLRSIELVAKIGVSRHILVFIYIHINDKVLWNGGSGRILHDVL